MTSLLFVLSYAQTFWWLLSILYMLWQKRIQIDIYLWGWLSVAIEINSCIVLLSSRNAINGLGEKTGVQKLRTDISSWHSLVHNWWIITITSVIDHATSFKKYMHIRKIRCFTKNIYYHVWIFSKRSAVKLRSTTNNDIDMIILNIDDIITWILHYSFILSCEYRRILTL